MSVNNDTIDTAVAGALGALKDSAHSPQFALAAMAEGALAREKGLAGGIAHIRIKGKSESFSHVKSALATKSGAPAQAFGKPVESTSQWEKVKAGVLLRHVARKGGLPVAWSEFDAQVLGECIERDEWAGEVAGQWQRGIEPARVKALLDDAGSGGTYVSPTWFDTQVAVAPILHGELVPMTTQIDLVRGSSVDGASFSTPSVTWGTNEGTSLDLITTSSLFSNLDTTVFPVAAALEVGLDLLSDSPVDLGGFLLDQMSQSLQNSLDFTIAVGDGTTQPTGIFTASGATSVAAANGTSGPVSVADVESLMFGLSKAMRSVYRQQICFVTTDTMYKRIRSVAVGTADARRLFGMDYGSYRVADYPVKICNSVTNGQIAFANLGFYKLFRRLGLSLRWTMEGATLARSNTSLLVLRARYGGKPTLGASIAKMTDAAIVG